MILGSALSPSCLSLQKEELEKMNGMMETKLTNHTLVMMSFIEILACPIVVLS